MIALLQRISQGSVSYQQDTHSVGQGFCVLVGVGHQDTQEDVDQLARKITHLRVFSDDDGKMNLDIQQTKGEILLISQFTLMANTSKGHRPSFMAAADPQLAESLYLALADALRGYGLKVELGFFGQHMHLDLQLDGPVTINLDTRHD